MRHIALLSADTPPCDGQIHYSPVIPQQIATPRPYRSLPILGAPNKSEPTASGIWTCERCGQRWTREPLPQEAL